MKEQVVVNNGKVSYYPKFENPIFLAAKKQELRNELLKRIKEGSFENLSSLIVKMNLTSREFDDIIAYWKNNNEALIYIYYYALINNDVNAISLADSLYQCYKLQVEAESYRQK